REVATERPEQKPVSATKPEALRLERLEPNEEVGAVTHIHRLPARRHFLGVAIPETLMRCPRPLPLARGRPGDTGPPEVHAALDQPTRVTRSRCVGGARRAVPRDIAYRTGMAGRKPPDAERRRPVGRDHRHRPCPRPTTRRAHRG